MKKQTDALKLALEALSPWAGEDANHTEQYAAYHATREALAEQPAKDNTYNYAKSLAEAIFKQHFASDEHYASGRVVWGVNDTVIGILTQIDNMVADMVRRPAQQQEPVARVTLVRSIIHRCPALKLPQEWWQRLGDCARIIPLVGATDAEAEEIVARLNAAPQPAQQQEPDYNICPTCGGMASDPIVPPAQRKPLTDEEIKEGWRKLPIQAPMSWSAYLAGARMAEAAHGITGEQK